MKNKNVDDLEFSTILGHASDEHSIDKNYVVQSSTFRLTFSFINLYALILILLFFIVKGNITAYFNSGFKYVCLIMLVYMLNSAIDNAVLFSGFMHLTDRPYFSAFSVTRPLFIIALFWVFIIHKDNKKPVKSV
jgi:hypothetical protein